MEEGPMRGRGSTIELEVDRRGSTIELEVDQEIRTSRNRKDEELDWTTGKRERMSEPERSKPNEEQNEELKEKAKRVVGTMQSVWW